MRAKLESIAGEPARGEGEGRGIKSRGRRASKQASKQAGKQAEAAIKGGKGREGRKGESPVPSMDFLRSRNLRLDYLFVGAINVGRARCDENLSITAWRQEALFINFLICLPIY